MEANIDALKLIQVDLAFSNLDGNLPDFRSYSSFVSEFNFNDIDIDTDVHTVELIFLLMKHGIDFKRNKEGIDLCECSYIATLSTILDRRR
ncbi:CCR4-NOT core DEDD RNase subunit [Sarracenia purpurea var. burkii]